MIYRQFEKEKLSLMGMGSVEIPCKNNKHFSTVSSLDDIDTEKLDSIIDTCMEGGVNYYETSCIYHNGYSETAIINSLSRYSRDMYNLAAKYHSSSKRHISDVFTSQLKKVDYFDFYLLQALSGYNYQTYRQAFKYLIQQKKIGNIRHIGISEHASLDVLRLFLEGFKDDIEFVQVQLNWDDYYSYGIQNHIELIREYNKPVFVMCPLKHGILKNLHKGPNWITDSFKFIYSFPEVAMILSGVENPDMAKNNIDLFFNLTPNTEEENNVLKQLSVSSPRKTNCINCGYCTTVCPQHLDIPNLLKNPKPNSCISCKQCEKICTQGICISDLLKVSRI